MQGTGTGTRKYGTVIGTGTCYFETLRPNYFSFRRFKDLHRIRIRIEFSCWIRIRTKIRTERILDP